MYRGGLWLILVFFWETQSVFRRGTFPTTVLGQECKNTEMYARAEIEICHYINSNYQLWLIVVTVACERFQLLL